MSKTIQRFGNRFLHRIFTAEELAYCQRKRNAVPHLAARFAAKEAAFKAIRKHKKDGIAWQDVWLENDGGPPTLRWSEEFGKRLREIGGQESWVSISHSRQFVVAQVIIVNATPEPRMPEFSQR